jgi:hypothetical protein
MTGDTSQQILGLLRSKEGLSGMARREKAQAKRKVHARKPIQAAAGAGALAAVPLFLVQLLLWHSQWSGPPTGVALVQHFLRAYGAPAIAAGGLLFWLAGLMWGVLYGAIMPRHNVLSGVIFSFAPTLFALFVVPVLLDKPVLAGGELKGILLPLILNALWGIMVGRLTPIIHQHREQEKRRE